MKLLPISLTCLGLALVPFGAFAQCPTAQIQSPNPVTFGYFGASADVDGDRMLVGTLLWNLDRSYLFERIAGQWLPKAVLTPNGGTPNMNFGSAVAIDGDYAAVSAPNFLNSAVYVYERQAGTWKQVAILKTTETLNAFGHALAMDGNVLAVSAIRDDQVASDAGAVHIFERGATGWVQVQKLTASDGGAVDEFGDSLAIQGDRLVIGALSGDGAQPGTGAVYVFERQAGQQPGSQWQQTAKLFASDGVSGDYFSALQSLALDGDRIAVGASRADVGCSASVPNCNTGAIYLFQHLAGQWSEVQKLVSPTPVNWSGYGLSLALDGALLAVGAQQEGPQAQGQMHLYRQTPTGWVLQSTISALAAGEGGAFSVHGLQGDLVLAGSAFMDGQFMDQGGLVTYSAGNQGCPSLIGIPSAISLAGGGTQTFELNAGPTKAFAPYLLLGSLNGTSPGQPIDGQILPLNADSYFLATLTGNAPLVGAAGLLDAVGRAYASLVLPSGAPAILAGQTAHHAFLTIQFNGAIPSVGFTSVGASLLLAP
jgi:hypothetical protein